MAETDTFYLLPTNVLASNYKLDLDLNFEKFSFNAVLDVDVEVISGKEIVLHSLDLTYSSNECVTLILGEKKINPSAIVPNVPQEIVTFQFDEDLPVGAGVLHFEFIGILSDKLAGLYRSQYKDAEGNKKFCVCSQMEPTDCRRVLPCFDEPARKATFELTTTHPGHMIALSNMPETSTVEISDGRKKTSFEKSPPMAPYLLALVVGEFDFLEKSTAAGVKVRCFTEKQKQEQGRTALDMAVATLDFYTEYFDIGYPLPKCDMIAISDFAAGAMENWGLITYRETALLIDPDTSPLANKQRVAYVVAHELAHQWFGNLVTMGWWGDLWLNEGFATWVGFLAVAERHPEWDYWTSFCATTVANAFDLDALETSHPIEVVVKTSGEINEIFDAISYHKGASLIRMLTCTLGEDKFRQGLRDYLKKFKYGNAATKDLWDSLSVSSGVDVHKLMSQWTKKMGFPVVSASLSDGKLQVKQERFLLSGVKEGEEAWHIPLHIVDGDNVIKTTFDEKEASFDVQSPLVRINPTYFGFYRTAYDASLLSLIQKEIPSFPTLDRLGFVSDCYAVTKGGLMDTKSFLEILEASFKEELEEAVWSFIISSLGRISSSLIDPASNEGWCGFVISLCTKAFSILGWEPAQGEPALRGLLRGRILSVLGGAGHPEVIEKAIELVKNDEAISPDLLTAVYSTAVRKGGKEMFQLMLEKYNNASMHEEAIRCLSALGQSKDKECIEKLLEMTLDEKQIRTSDAVIVYRDLGASNTNRPIAWNFMKTRWDDINNVFGGIAHLFHRMIAATISNFSDEESAKDVEAFFKEHHEQVVHAARALEQGTESIKNNIDWKNRDGQLVATYLSSFA